MNTKLRELSATALRDLLIQENKKFIRALEWRSTLSDLEEMRAYIIEIEEALNQKEKESSLTVEPNPRSSESFPDKLTS